MSLRRAANKISSYVRFWLNHFFFEPPVPTLYQLFHLRNQKAILPIQIINHVKFAYGKYRRTTANENQARYNNRTLHPASVCTDRKKTHPHKNCHFNLTIGILQKWNDFGERYENGYFYPLILFCGYVLLNGDSFFLKCNKKITPNLLQNRDEKLRVWTW